ncbi:MULTISPECIES: helix-turn-helix domain-containing protein [Bradyrhizobium]|uniref:helix-turn-helix domain-containing protein n=1 Tax=Bradyrhizobium TaxID=374 RepID=UPI0004B1650D|nr:MULTISPECIES: AraC family transcriptional regulator [Bradyrhizobium]MCS3450276.1 AraC-like DNA-binding protein [Bradyrhizobium elkanii]MCS3558579.1 AraC-like DNA-binding protein [Bradyrhizobium elkanii]MCW2151574.1 AraC-like DNA-binding protein [Bradyrhizobium elkanii]MCW2358553.1 AraC-like DNA-binding protein [Bradyrhizobium elkanii]MCW2375305.1 AraC-like DNA-binding protein [Bradyrhizobium elkanii]
MHGSESDTLRMPVSAAYARALVRAFGQTRSERDELLKGTGIRLEALDQPGAHMPVSSLVVLAANITRRHGELWPLSAAAVWSTSLQGALDVATRTAPTIADALATGARFGSTRAPFVRNRLRKTARAIQIEISPAVAMDVALWHAVALAVSLNVHAVYVQLLEDAIGEATLQFPWPPPEGAERLLEHYSCAVKFNAAAFVFEVPKALGARPSPFADPQLHAKAIEALEAIENPQPDTVALAGIVERLIAARLPQRLAEEEAARLVGTSRRTLVRRLAETGSAFRPLLDGVLRERARIMLAAGTQSRDEMAAALGYTDATSFSRACRRWFGEKAGGRD